MSHTKRIAIELYGLSRSYKEAFPSFYFNLLQTNLRCGYIVDVFIHTWAESDTSNISWHNPHGEQRGQDLSLNDYEDILDKYRPKIIIVDDPIKFDKEAILSERLKGFSRSYSSLISCFYSRYAVNEARKQYEELHNLRYDWVLMTRFDIQFYNPFEIGKFLKTFQDYGYPVKTNAIYVACSPFKRGLIDFDDFSCCLDLILFAKPYVMDKVTFLYQDLMTETISVEFIYNSLYSMEALWMRYWKLKHIECIKLKYFEGNDYRILRLEENQISKSKRITGLYPRLRQTFTSFCLHLGPAFRGLTELPIVFFYLLKIGLKFVFRFTSSSLKGLIKS